MGIMGTGISFSTQLEETKESVVGRRDLFKIPDELRTKKKPLSQVRQKPSMLAKLTSQSDG